MEEKNKKRIITAVIFTAIMVMFLLIKSAGFIKIDVDDFKSSGHGKYYSSGASSFFRELGILENFDYVDDETGESYCFDDDCWDDAEAEYEICMGGELELSAEKILSYVEIIPSVCAIGIGDELADECDRIYEETLITECSRRCEEEIYVWDGTTINDLSEFSLMAFPNFIEDSEFTCEAWFIDGDWISQPDKVGCLNGNFLNCDTNSLVSAGEVCEIIEKNWYCDGFSAYCSE